MDGWSIRGRGLSQKSSIIRKRFSPQGTGISARGGVFEEGYPGRPHATFLMGSLMPPRFVVTELANAPDWLPLDIFLHGERFALNRGKIQAFERTLDPYVTGILRARRVGVAIRRARDFTFERFASLAAPHNLFLRGEASRP